MKRISFPERQAGFRETRRALCNCKPCPRLAQTVMRAAVFSANQTPAAKRRAGLETLRFDAERAARWRDPRTSFRQSPHFGYNEMDEPVFLRRDLPQRLGLGTAPAVAALDESAPCQARPRRCASRRPRGEWDCLGLPRLRVHEAGVPARKRSGVDPWPGKGDADRPKGLGDECGKIGSTWRSSSRRGHARLRGARHGRSAEVLRGALARLVSRRAGGALQSGASPGTDAPWRCVEVRLAGSPMNERDGAQLSIVTVRSDRPTRSADWVLLPCCRRETRYGNRY
jgi:hypothetical protein